mgnify:CR=1 FL=1
MKVQNIWLMHLNQSRYCKYSFHKIFFSLQYVTFNYFLQTLTTLNLSVNEIGAQGAKYLADALKSVMVLQIFFPQDLLLSIICHIQLFLTDTNHTQLELQ